MAEKLCASCAAWQAPPPETKPGPTGVVMGQCRRHPPTPFVIAVQTGNIIGPGKGQHPQQTPTIISAWPPAPSTGGCMDWLAEETEKAQGDGKPTLEIVK